MSAGADVETTDGFLVVDKPPGPTSHDVVARVRRMTGIRRVGHAGTLDPFATGVLVVAVGRATRLVRYIQDLPKEYVATARFGVGTDTLDATGTVTETVPMAVSAADVERVLGEFVGTILQVPPMVSAVKVGGERLYRLARAGVEVERQARPVEVAELELVDVEPGAEPLVTLRVVCGKGTYVRVLADDIARALDGRAHLVALRRTRLGGFGADAVPLDELESDWRAHIVSPAGALAHLPAVVVSGDERAGVANGRRLSRACEGKVRVLDEAGTLLGIYRGDGTDAVPEVVVA